MILLLVYLDFKRYRLGKFKEVTHVKANGKTEIILRFVYKEATNSNENDHFTLTFRFLLFAALKMFIQYFCLPTDIDHRQLLFSSSEEPPEGHYIYLSVGTNAGDMPRSHGDTTVSYPISVSNLQCCNTNKNNRYNLP